MFSSDFLLHQLGMAEPPKAKKPKRVCHFDREWTKEFPGIGTGISHFDHISVLVIIMLSAINILINTGLVCGCGFY